MSVKRPPGGGVSAVLALWARLKEKAERMIEEFEWRDAVLHPLVFSVFPVLSLYVRNMGQGFLREALLMAAGVLVSAALAWALVHLLVRDARRSAVIVSAFYVLFFSYGHAVSAAAAALDRLGLRSWSRFLVEGGQSLWCGVAVWVALFGAAAVVVTMIKSDLRSLTSFLNVVAIGLAVVVTVSFGRHGASMYLPVVRARLSDSRLVGSVGVPERASESRSFLPVVGRVSPEKEVQEETNVSELISSWQEEVPGTADASSPSPDVYYLIVDAYARADILEELYQLDNSQFLSYLTQEGFYVADGSVANYAQSALSFASSLNFAYLDDLVNEMGTEINNRQPLQEMIRQSRVFEYFRNQGYRVVAFSSGYGPTDLTDADVYEVPDQPWKLTEFQEALIMLTPVSVLPQLRSDPRRDRIRYALDHIPDAGEMDGPVFVFAHITAPHFPFIFDAEGRSIEPPRGVGNREDYEYAEYIEGYRDQLTFINKKLMAAVDEILARSSEPPIIILQSDHGPSGQLAPGWDVEQTNLSERMSILNAYYFPDQRYDRLYPHISPVNTFRVVLNEYFGTGLPLLEDRSYFSSWGRPYRFFDVTEEVLADR